MSAQEIYKTDIPLERDKKGRYYLPDYVFYDVVNNETILVKVPEICEPTYKLVSYRVHFNKDGSCWIKGCNIAKYWFYRPDDAPNRLFLSEKIIKKLNDK